MLARPFSVSKAAHDAAHLRVHLGTALLPLLPQIPVWVRWVAWVDWVDAPSAAEALEPVRAWVGAAESTEPRRRHRDGAAPAPSSTEPRRLPDVVRV